MNKKQIEKELNEKTHQLNIMQGELTDVMHTVETLKSQLDDVKSEIEFPYELESWDNWKGYCADTKKTLECSPYIFTTKWYLNNKKTYAQFKLQYIADQLNGDWKVDYKSSNQVSYVCYYDPYEEKWDTCAYSYKHTAVTYFKSLELAKHALSIMNTEMDYFLT